MIVYDSDSVIHQMNAESSCYDSKFQKIYNSPHVRAIFIFTGWLLFNLYMNSFTNDLRIHLLYGFISSCGFLLIIIFILCEDACSIFQYGFFWRIALSYSIIYLLTSNFFLFQNVSTIKSILTFLDPKLMKNFTDSKDYSSDCQFKVSSILPLLDAYCFYHIAGWVFKTLIIRHSILLFYLSIMWEFTEVIFQPILPELNECWWDTLFLDIIVCNGVGILVGNLILKHYQVKSRKWTRAHILFPRSLENNTSQENSLIIIQDSKMIKILELTFFSLMINVGELNAFLLKQTYVPFFLHWLNVIRLFLVSILSLRGIEEHYNFFSKKNTKNFGMFHFFVIINFILEFLLILNHNNEITNRIDRNRIFLWIFSQFASIYFLVHFSDSYIAGQKEQMKQTVDVKQKLT